MAQSIHPALDAVLCASRRKAALPPGRALVLGVMAGMFIALAGVGAAVASATFTGSAARLASALVFPTGLSMILAAGGELFTGNSLMVAALVRREITLRALLRNWALVYAGNFIGSVLIAALCALGGLFSLLPDGALAQGTIACAAAKCALPFSQAFFRGVLCNILVCAAVWMGFSVASPHAKALVIYLPVMLFVLAGLEHCVANMYAVPAGLLAKAQYPQAALLVPGVQALTVRNFLLQNLLPVTLGNVAGGALLLALPYLAVYAPERAA